MNNYNRAPKTAFMSKTKLFNYYSSKIVELGVRLTRSHDNQLRHELKNRISAYHQYRDTYLELIDCMDQVLDSRLSKKDKTKLYRMYLDMNRKVISIHIDSIDGEEVEYDNPVIGTIPNEHDVKIKKNVHTVPAGKEDEFLSDTESSDGEIEASDDNDFVPHHFRNTHI